MQQNSTGQQVTPADQQQLTVAYVLRTIVVNAAQEGVAVGGDCKCNEQEDTPVPERHCVGNSLANGFRDRALKVPR